MRYDPDPQNRFSTLRSFEIWGCLGTVSNSDCSGTTGWVRIGRFLNAFASDLPRPLMPNMLIKQFDVTAMNADHLRLVVLDNACTGNPLYHGEQDNDPANDTDCVAASEQGGNVRIAELQALRRRAVAAVHAGWRGTVRRIAEQAVGALRERYGTDPRDCVAALGPGIRGCCYEVDAPVMEPLSRALADWGACASQRGAGRWLLDLAAANRRMLEGAGLDPAAIHDAGLCTRCRPALFYSHRGQGPTTGRMMNAILLTA